MLTFGSLFAGVGGFDLGLERAGMRCLWQCEIDPYAQRVLAKHWPDVLRVPNIRDLHAGTVPEVSVIAGGFPCQPVSDAGLKHAQDDPRWLWPQFARVVRELRPRYVIVENVPGLLRRGVDEVLGDLAELGFDAEWDCVSAADVGAPHLRKRFWLVAYANTERRDRRPRVFGPGWRAELENRSGWEPEPDVDRVAPGIPNRVDRVASLGNALIPQIAELIGRRIVAYEEGQAERAIAYLIAGKRA